MSAHGTRIGNFTFITPACVMGSIATIGILGAVGGCWSQSMANPDSVSWLVTGLVTAAGIPLAIGCLYWALSNYVRWVEVGESLTFATPLGSQTVAWDTLRGIEFETEYKTIPLVVVPFSIVVDQNCVAVLTLANRRELRGRVDYEEAMLLHELLRHFPKLDTHFVRALFSPRSTMTTFVDAVMEDELAYASMFLDFSQFDAPTAEVLAGPCAQKLKDVIDSVWFIDYEEVPDDPYHPSPYTLASGSDQEIDPAMSSVVEAIKIGRDPSSGFWRFESDTVQMIVTEFLNAEEGDPAAMQTEQ